MPIITSVTSGEILSGVTLTTNDLEYVLNGGVTSNIVATDGGEQYLEFGGTSFDTLVEDGGNQTIQGDSFFTTVSNGTQYVSSGGIASGTTIDAAGGLEAGAGLVISAIVNVGGAITDAGTGILSGVVVSGGYVAVNGGGVARDSLLTFGGSGFVYSGGFASGTVVESGAFLTISDGVADGGTVSAGGSEFVASGGTASGVGVASNGELFVSSAGSAVSTVIENGGMLVMVSDGGIISDLSLQNGALIDLAALAFSAGGSAAVNGSDQLVVTEGANSQTLSLTGSYSGEFFHLSDAGGQTEVLMNTTPPCFVAGTQIMTDRGEIAVQDLAVGDQVVALVRGGFAAVKWIGHRAVDLTRHPAPRDAQPVRVRAGSFSENTPRRDVWLSPDHAVFFQGSLVSVRHLINGATITQEAWPRVVYYHLELDAHDVVLADGLAAESFLDVGNKAAFDNGGVEVMAHPDFKRRLWDAQACAPSLHTVEQRAALRAHLEVRALAAGFALNGDAQLQILAANRVILPFIEQGICRFTLPAGAARVRLMSRTQVPGWLVGGVDDGRCLGIGVIAVWLDGVKISLEHARFLAGWHQAERELRWSDGAGEIEVAGVKSLALRLHQGLRYWVEVQQGRAVRRA